MPTPVTTFTDAIMDCGLVPLPAHITGVRVPNARSKQGEVYAVQGLHALAAHEESGKEILSALEGQGWVTDGELLISSSPGERVRPLICALTVTVSDIHGDEGYRLSCTSIDNAGAYKQPTSDGAEPEAALDVRIEASASAGFFYAGLTFSALAREGLVQSGLVVEDRPRFAYRGLMVDVARSFLPLNSIEDLIRAMATLKLNVLHLHLVDDQGWRMEITNEGRAPEDTTDYTALHRKGGKSACNPGTDPGFDLPEAAVGGVVTANTGFETIGPGIPGYYTQEELRTLVEYAARHHIRVIPELEFPGHNHVVLHSLPHLATSGASVQDTGDGVAPWTRWQVGHSYLDFNNEDTWRFTRHVITQVGCVFGWEQLHLGGDEAFKMLRSVGQDAYDDAVNRVVSVAKECGFQEVMVWQEGAEALTSPHDMVQLWNCEAANEMERLIQACRDRGLRIVHSDARHIYLDQKRHPTDPLGLTWACPNGLPTRTAYEWDPLESLPLELWEQVAGVEACLWSETVRGSQDAAALLFPRLLAAAEVAWTPQDTRNWSDFVSRALKKS